MSRDQQSLGDYLGHILAGLPQRRLNRRQFSDRKRHQQLPLHAGKVLQARQFHAFLVADGLGKLQLDQIQAPLVGGFPVPGDRKQAASAGQGKTNPAPPTIDTKAG